MELPWPFVLVGLLAFVMFVWPMLSLLAWCYEAAGSAFRRTRAVIRRYRRNEHFHRTGHYTWTPQPFVATLLWRALRQGELPQVEFVRTPAEQARKDKREAKRLAKQQPVEESPAAPSNVTPFPTRPSPSAPMQPKAAAVSGAPVETPQPPARPRLKAVPAPEPTRQPQTRPQTPPQTPKPARPAVPASQPMRWRGDQESREIVMRMVREQPGRLNAADLAKLVQTNHSKSGGRKHKPPSEETIRRMVRQMQDVRMLVPVAGGSRPRYVTSDASGQPGR